MRDAGATLSAPPLGRPRNKKGYVVYDVETSVHQIYVSDYLSTEPGQRDREHLLSSEQLHAEQRKDEDEKEEQEEKRDD